MVKAPASKPLRPTAYILVGARDPGIVSDTMVTCTDTTRLEEHACDRYVLVTIDKSSVVGRTRYAAGGDIVIDTENSVPIQDALGLVATMLDALALSAAGTGAAAPTKAVRVGKGGDHVEINTRSMHLRVVK